MNEVSACYIHIPFCQTICSYCDFCKIFYQEEIVDKYLKILSLEIKKRYKGEVLSTIYIGGGTPSSLSFQQLHTLFSIIQQFKREKNVEITFECNIEDIEERKLKILKKYGVNRLSIGVQTFHTKFLQYLNRNHSKEEVFQKIELAKKMGFSNINIDLMYGFKEETIKDVEEDVNFFLELNIPHLSIYSLILEPHTRLFIQGEEGVSEEMEADMYFQIKKMLLKRGYKQYEVSNFAKEGYFCFHNLTYWNNEHYYGFGVSASGYLENIRYDHTKSISHYIEGNIDLKKEILDLKKTIENEWILGFRKTKGISKEKFYKKYKIRLENLKIIQKLLAEEKLKQNDTHVYINPKYTYVMNEILIELIDSKEGIK